MAEIVLSVPTWPGPPGILIRTAASEDERAIERVLALNRQSIEPRLIPALKLGTVGNSLQVSPERRLDLIVQAQSTVGAVEAFPGLSTLLLAEDEQQGVVGALQVLVPGQVAFGLLRQGVDFDSVAAMIATVTKLASLAVVEPARRQGIAAALIERARRIYMRAEFALMYGQFHVGTGLESFYEHCRFDILDEGEPIALPPYIPFFIGPDPGDRLIARWHPAHAQWRTEAYTAR